MTSSATISAQSEESAAHPGVNTALVALNFLCAYLELSLYYDNGLIFPNFGAFAVGLVSVLYNRSDVKPRHLFLLFAIAIAILAMTVAANLLSGVPASENYRSLAQMIASIGSGYGIFLATTRAGLRNLAYLFLGIVAAIIIGVFIERFDAVREFSDSVRTMIYDPAVLYFGERRDLLEYGAIRPKFFTREPSLVGINLGFAMVVALLAAPNLRLAPRIGLCLAITLLSAWLIRSPTMLFFFAIVVLGSFMLPLDDKGPRRFERLLFAAAFAFILLAGPIATFLAARFEGPLSEVVYGGSFYLRMVGPSLVAIEVAQQAPIVGMGVGSYDQIFDTTRSVYASSGAFAYFPYLLDEGDTRYLVTNAFWELLIFFGLFGFALIAFLFRGLLLSLGLRSVLFPFVASAYAAQTFGGPSAYRFWYFFFTFAALAHLMLRRTRASGAQGSLPAGSWPASPGRLASEADGAHPASNMG